MKIYNLPFYGCVYQAIMRLAHKYNWHYAPPIYPDGDTQLWCKWCGFRQTIKYRDKSKDVVSKDLSANKAHVVKGRK